MKESRDIIKSEFKYYLTNVARSARRTSDGFNLGDSAVSSFLTFIEPKKLFDYAPEKWQHIESMYDLTEPEEVKKITNELLNDKSFMTHDYADNQQYRSGALMHYTCFINARSFFRSQQGKTISKRSSDQPTLQQFFYGAPGTEYIRSYLTALRTKPFMLLAGISGTGKSRIVRKLAQATTTQKYDNEEDRWKDNRPENFELIQVKPNWHNSMDVVGFYSNISKKYEFTPFVEFIAKAWQHKETPYFLCLDEMNLAPVEEYFAEFLSAIESRSTDENGDYITDPIIKPFKKFGEKEGKAMLIHLLGDADPIDKNPIAIHFYEKGLTLPPNLMVMGTVNMDETTFSFSRKVLDRAMSVEMNEVDYDKFLSGESEQFPLLTDMNELLVNRPQRAAEVTEEIESDKVIAYLKEVNTLLEGTPFKLGYRAANEAMLYVAACKKFAGNDYDLAKALDEFTLMKILSRIEGDDSRLGIADDDPRIATLGIETSEQHTSLLTCLKAIIRKHIGASCETEKKIDQMCNTLEREHFVSYWA